MRGDIYIEMEVDSLMASNQVGKGGIMIRDSLDSDSKHFSLLVPKGVPLANQWRTERGGSTSDYREEAVNDKKLHIKISKIGHSFQA